MINNSPGKLTFPHVRTTRLADLAGHDVLVVEQGTQPGTKNLSGGVLHCRVIEHVWPDLVHQTPVERVITRTA